MFVQKHYGSIQQSGLFMAKNIIRKKCHHSLQHRNELSHSLLQLWLEYYLKEYSESGNNFRNFPVDRLLTQALVGFSCRSLIIESFVFKSVCGGPLMKGQVTNLGISGLLCVWQFSYLGLALSRNLPCFQPRVSGAQYVLVGFL